MTKASHSARLPRILAQRTLMASAVLWAASSIAGTDTTATNATTTDVGTSADARVEASSTPAAPAPQAGAAPALASASAAHVPRPADVTQPQYDTARQVAQQGVPLQALAANAPDTYTIKPGDTLWGLSRIFLNEPWRWPELWGMNLQAIANPHRIYPGQTLYLHRSDTHARLGTSPDAAAASAAAGGARAAASAADVDSTQPETVRLSPRVRSESVSDLAVPTVAMHLIEPFLTDPLVTPADPLTYAPRLIAANDERRLVTKGDTVYARSSTPGAALVPQQGQPREYRILRKAVPLRDPQTQEVLGYESHAIGHAVLLQGEVPAPQAEGALPMPATMRITHATAEILPGDRLLPQPPRQFLSFVPHAPLHDVDARIVSLFPATRYGSQHQVIAINRGVNDGIEPGMVLSLITAGRRIVDKTDPAHITNPGSATVQLPDRTNGVAMVFRSFERVSYALIMNVLESPQVGDRLTSPN